MAEETEADKAYKAALAEIARVREAGETMLRLTDATFAALEQIPPEVADIPGLSFLDLDGTRISNLTPLAALTGLQMLSLKQTPVTDLAPIAALTGLQQLYLNQTAVTDLAPIAALTGLQWLNLNQTAVTDLAPIAALTGLQGLALNQTAVADLAPIAALTGLQELSLDQTAVTDLAPIAALTGLQELCLNQTAVTDLAPIAALTGLQRLDLNQTGVTDMRPILPFTHLGEDLFGDLSFDATPATAKDPELARLALIEDSEDRIRQTLAYLKTLPPWPEPLPWLEPPRPLPAPDPAVPLQAGEDGISMVTLPISAGELDDPIREALHEALTEQTAELKRIAGNMDEAAYRQTCKLQDLLEPGLAAMAPLKVHLAIEALRRIHRTVTPPVDRDYLLALEAVIETGPGLTLDTKQVQLFVDRAQRNRLERLAEAEAEAQIRLANSIAASGLSAPDVKSMASRAADDQVYDQFTAIRPTLGRNFVLEVAKYVVPLAVGGIIANRADWLVLEAWNWLATNAADLRVMAAVWGEPFLAWLTPILDRAPQVIEAANRAVNRLKSRD